MDKYQVIALEDVPQWDDEADAIIVGFGAAGSCAALGAAEQGGGI